MNLFVDGSIEFDKVASAEAALPEDPNAWGDEVLQELHKQVPYVADFDPEIVMNQVDGQRGFGFGFVLVGNKTELPQDAEASTLEAAGVKQIRIPIIIKENKLQPLDLLVTGDGKTLPLTETRLREALFRPQAFDMTARSPGDTSLINQLFPPMRQTGGTPTAQTGSIDMGKMGSMLDCVLPTLTQHDHAAFLTAITEPALQAAFVKNAHAAAAPVARILHAEPLCLQKNAGVIPHLLSASVAQIVKEASGYSLKTASVHMWRPVVQPLDRGEALRRFGAKTVLAADLNGGVTIANEAESDGEEEGAAEEDGPPPALITDYGIYRVRDDQGRDLMGYVFPNLLDLDGMKLPLALFTNGSQSAVQGEIVGTPVGEALPMHEGKPKGRGCFFTLEGGEASATLPLTIQTSFTGPDGSVALMAQAETIDNQPVEVHVQPNLQKMMLVDDKLLVPDTYRWLSLEGSEPVVLDSGAEGAEDVGKEARAQHRTDTVVVRGFGDQFSFDGAPLHKVAADQKSYLSTADAVFLLAGLGVRPDHAQRKLAQASLGRAPITVRVGRQIKTAEEAERGALQRAATWLEQVPDLRRVLFKEAAVIPDPGAVDTVLSLGFINPENTAHMLKAMPQIETSQQSLCELLLATRLGIKEIPVSAIERAVHAVEEVLSGLKVLAFQKN